MNYQPELKFTHIFNTFCVNQRAYKLNDVQYLTWVQLCGYLNGSLILADIFPHDFSVV